MLGLSSTSSFAVFVYLYILHLYFFVFLRLTRVNIILDILEQSSFQKYAICWVFPALDNNIYVFVYLCTCKLDALKVVEQLLRQYVQSYETWPM